MAATCRGICRDYESKGIRMKFKYRAGQKRCTYCGLFIVFEGVRCPCCKTILRTKPRSPLLRQKKSSHLLFSKKSEKSKVDGDY